MPDQKKSRCEVLEAFVASQPNDAFSRYALAMEYMNSGNSTAADTHFRELLQRNADYVPAYLMYGQFLVRESRPAEAKDVLTLGVSAATRAGNSHALSEIQSLLSDLS